MKHQLEKWFRLKENATTVKTEIIAGVTTFMTMAYILAVNPRILGECGMNPNAVLIVSCLAAFIGTMFMALFANYPFALAPAMGLNAYFAYTVCGSMGYSWQVGLLAVFVEGLIFLVMSLTNIREQFFNAIPKSIKSAVSVGIGIYIAFIGLQDAKIVVNNDATLVSLQSFSTGNPSVVVGAVLAIIGVLFTAILMVKKVKGNILIGILVTWGLGMICQLVGIYVPDPDAGMYSLFPSAIVSLDFSAISETAFACFDKTVFSSIRILDFIVIMFAFLFVDLFDTLGTLIGVSAKANMLDSDGKLPRIKGALLADSLATSIGAVLGTSTTTTYVESASGVTEGGRTGLTAMTTAILFLLSTIFSPLFLAIPSFAIAPALIVVGFYMMGNVASINFEDALEAIPCFLCIIIMPLTYSISEGISIGIISWTIIKLLTGKAKEKKISVLMYILTVLFILKYVIL